MSFDLGSIRATLGLDESNFVSGMVSAQTASAVFGQGIVNFVNNPLLGTVEAMKKVATTAKDWVAQTIEADQELARLSQQTGIATEYLAGLKLAAEENGSTLDQFADSLRQVAIRAAEAARGEGAADTFNRLGVSVTKADGTLKSIRDLMGEVAQALANVENQTERVALADELLSDAGTALLPVFQQGREALQEYVKDAKKFGTAISRETGQEAIQFGLVMSQVTSILDGLKQSMTTGFLDGFTRSLKSNKRDFQQLAKVLNDIVKPALEGVGLAFAGLVDVLSSDWLRELINGLREVGDVLEPVVKLVGTLLEYVGKLAEFATDSWASFFGLFMDHGSVESADTVRQRMMRRQEELQQLGRVTVIDMQNNRDREISRALGG